VVAVPIAVPPSKTVTATPGAPLETVPVSAGSVVIPSAAVPVSDASATVVVAVGAVRSRVTVVVDPASSGPALPATSSTTAW
jgi:hypothetical protein